MKHQNERLIAALRRRKRGMTTGEIREKLGIGMPATRIFELKGLGFRIDTEMVRVTNRYGETCRVARYTLVGEPAASRRLAA